MSEYQIDIISWMTRTALELISQTGLGYSFDPLTEDEVPHPYTQAAKHLMYVLRLQPLLDHSFFVTFLMDLVQASCVWFEVCEYLSQWSLHTWAS